MPAKTWSRADGSDGEFRSEDRSRCLPRERRTARPTRDRRSDTCGPAPLAFRHVRQRFCRLACRLHDFAPHIHNWPYPIVETFDGVFSSAASESEKKCRNTLIGRTEDRPDKSQRGVPDSAITYEFSGRVRNLLLGSFSAVSHRSLATYGNSSV